MRLTSFIFTLFNIASKPDSLPQDPTAGPFELSSYPYSDLWRIPKVAGGRDDFNGTIYATPIKLQSFKRIGVTVTAEWESRYAQGGLVFFLPGRGNKPITTPSNGGNVTRWHESPPVWIKTGIEFENNITFASLVASNPLSDWGIAPWRENSIMIELERSEGALWAYATRLSDGSRTPIRQITWAFDQEERRGDVWVGVFTAMPLPHESVPGGGELQVKFENLTIETLDD